MTDTSPRLDLPYLQPAQAQKHVTHNEALRRLDALVQMTVLAMAAETPPAAPEAGDMYALGEAPLAAWAGQEGRLTFWDGSAWQFLQPQEGWRLYDLGSRTAHVFETGIWREEMSGLTGLGVGTAPDTTNRLAVAAPASLFSHEGGGHQIKVNKAGAGDTASLLFQSGWTGHAEMGLIGDSGFAVKVSGDGSDWAEALRILSDGKVGIGETNPAETLDVDGCLRASRPSNGPLLKLRHRGAAEDNIEIRVTNSGSATLEVNNICTLQGAAVSLWAAGSETARATGSQLRPGADNAQDLGSAAWRWGNVYAGNGTINTSDADCKQDIAALDEAELRVAGTLRGLVRKFRFRDAVAGKGEAARIHVGLVAQDVIEAFRAEDLDPWRYGILCRDVWWVSADGGPGEGEPGRVFEREADAPEGATRHERLGIRYGELLAFVLAAI